MSTLTLAYGRPTLAERIFSRRLVLDIVLVASGAALTSVLAQVAIPLWPVPITVQTFAVLFVGATLGATRGAISLALYALLGLVGLALTLVLGFETPNTRLFATCGALTLAAPLSALWHFAATRALTREEKRIWIRGS